MSRVTPFASFPASTVEPARLSRGSRLATAALAIAFVGVIGQLWVTDNALKLAAEAREHMVAQVAPGASTPDAALNRDLESLRTSAWLFGFAALGAVVAGLMHERRLARRVAERSAELERLSGELIQVNRTKSEFLANVSHELRTPLNAIVGFVDLLQDGVYGPLAPRQTAPVQRLASSAAHLRELVDQILDLAKISAGRLDVNPETVHLRPFVLDVATELEPLVQAKGLALSLAVPATLPRVRTDPMHLRQILVNLLGNAVKFTPEGRVSVRAALGRRRVEPPPLGDGARFARAATSAASLLIPGRRRRTVEEEEADAPRWVALQVIDTGIGIPDEEQERIFDEFEQIGPRTGDSSVRGTGLGLAISRRLARLLGGDLTVESAPGKGATFTLWLQVEEADAAGRELRAG
jgi:signal transduction histidine kinase